MTDTEHNLDTDNNIEELQIRLKAAIEEQEKLSVLLQKREEQMIHLSNSNGRLMDMIDVLRRERDQAIVSRDAIADSEFWKLSEPIRALADVIKGINSNGDRDTSDSHDADDSIIVSAHGAGYTAAETNSVSVRNRAVQAWKEDTETFADGVKVSVVIPTYNAGAQLDDLLAALRRQRLDGELEIVVIDSGSTDGTIETAEKYDAKIITIRHEDFSHSYARNHAAVNSSGNIILFMTQDAFPTGDDWVERMIEPIVNKQAAAVSAMEQCPEATELFYKVSTLAFTKFLGTYYGDCVNRLDSGEKIAPEELRSKANLMDVACAIDRKLFEKYRYRYNYAEDLDMGIRLLRGGYTIILSGTVKVLHGHNRSCGYYVKRFLIDRIARGNIIPESENSYDGIHEVALRICSAADAVQTVFSENSESTSDGTAETLSCAEYVTELSRRLRRIAGEPSHFREERIDSFGDELLDRTVDLCRQYCRVDYLGDYLIVDGLLRYMEEILPDYMAENKLSESAGVDMVRAIDDCIMKQMSILIGEELSKLRWSFVLFEKFSYLLEGV